MSFTPRRKRMRAILIDPFNETVTEVEHNGDYKNIYQLLSQNEEIQCKHCKEFFAKYSCGADRYGECDCPRCQGYCECIDKVVVNTFTIVELNDNRDTMFVDDEGLLKLPKYFFQWRGYDQPLAGKGLILGTNDEGESISPVITLDRAKDNVVWANDLEFVELVPFEDTVDHPILGKNTPIFGNRPLFVKKVK